MPARSASIVVRVGGPAIQRTHYLSKRRVCPQVEDKVLWVAQVKFQALQAQIIGQAWRCTPLSQHVSLLCSLLIAS